MNALLFALFMAATGCDKDPRPCELTGSRARLAAENKKADRLNLSRVAHADQILSFANKGLLVRVERTAPGYYVDKWIGVLSCGKREKIYPRRDDIFHLRPWTKEFLDTLAQVFTNDLSAGSSFKVTSLIRTPVYQKMLKCGNRSAARSTRHSNQSLHFTGAAFDISALTWSKDGKPPMTVEQRNSLRALLARLDRAGCIEAVEERNPPNFHITVWPEFSKNPKCKQLLIGDSPTVAGTP